MRLLNTRSLALRQQFIPSEVPDYVILSHRWSTEEVTFEDISKAPISDPQSQTRNKNGFAKIQGACNLAVKDGYAWIWIDSCCIDKSSSAELQEAINSMWRYYAESNICYVYLADVSSEAGWSQMFARSEWFTRGWTLQELIAPVCVEFYSENWKLLGTKFERYKQIAEITSINPGVLIRSKHLDLFSVAERLSWAAHRNVTREEDEAYSLLGLFYVNMPLLYGEGREKAFVRLQEAIYNTTTDQSMFLFRNSLHIFGQPLLADSPRRFCDRVICTSCASRGIRCLPSNVRYTDIVISERWETQAHEHIMTTVTMFRNEMSTVLPLLNYDDISNKLEYFDDPPRTRVTHVAILNHTLAKYPKGAFCLPLYRQTGQDSYVRLGVFPAILPDFGDITSEIEKTKILVCPGPKGPGTGDKVLNVFTFKSDLFRLETWNYTGHTTNSPPSARQISEFRIMTAKSKKFEPRRTVSCVIVCTQDPSLLLYVQLIHIDNVWSITEILERNLPRLRTRTLFSPSVLADRCSVRVTDEMGLLVELRRLPGSARTRQENGSSTVRYQISVERIVENDNRLAEPIS